MEDADLRMDGNAAAGALAEIFAFDVTTAQAVCANCGAEGAVGTLTAYGLAMGAILRCPSCLATVIRVGQHRNDAWLDLRGMSVLRIRSADQ